MTLAANEVGGERTSAKKRVAFSSSVSVSVRMAVLDTVTAHMTMLHCTKSQICTKVRESQQSYTVLIGCLHPAAKNTHAARNSFRIQM